jgi:hypothetical protein
MFTGVGFAVLELEITKKYGGYAGKQKRGNMSTTKAVAAHPMG